MQVSRLFRFKCRSTQLDAPSALRATHKLLVIYTKLPKEINITGIVQPSVFKTFMSLSSSFLLQSIMAITNAILGI